MYNKTSFCAPQWVYPQDNEEWVNRIIKEFMVHPIMAQVLASRGFSTLDEIHSYLYAQLPNLHPPSRFKDMKRATERIIYALDNQQAIMIYGDNDVDGITATALLVEFIRKAGGTCHFFIPQKNSSKHEVLMDSLEEVLQKKCKLLITVDCGITASEEIKQFQTKNIDVIITDHHIPTEKIPHSYATLNPKLITSKYPNRELTGVGVAFKLACALTHSLVSQGRVHAKQIDLKEYLDLVALGTIADMGSLRGENRILVRYGLKQLSNTKRVGIKQLINVCAIAKGPITSNDIMLKIAPRINSLGRIANPLKGVDLLLAKDPLTAEELANELDLHNKLRQKIEQEMVSHMDYLLTKQLNIHEHKGIVLSSEDWHMGIVPLLTTRLNRYYHRPAVTIAIENGVGKGSIRSIKSFPLLGHLSQMQELFISYGGHDYAAGITIKEENIPEFKQRFIQAADNQLADQEIAYKLHLDAPLSFNQINFDLMESLELLEPYGQDNPPPIFYTDAMQAWQPKVFKNEHLKFFLEQNDIILEGIAFHFASHYKSTGYKRAPLKIAFTPQTFQSQSQSRVQLHIKAFDKI